MADVDVLIVGAGPTGLTSACELARHGIRPRIIDRSPTASDKSKAFVVHARTLELFENMGMVEPVLASGSPASGITFYDGGAAIVTVELTGKIASKYPFIQIIAQSDTEKILAEHLASYGLAVEREVELCDFTDEGDHVRATLRRADGTTESVSCRALIGNDGAHSTVRKQLGLPFEGAPYPNQWLLADMDLHWELPYDELSVFFHGTGTTAFFPLYGRRGRLMFEVPDAPVDQAQPEPTLDDVRRLCEARAIPIRDVTNATWLAWFRLHHRMVSRYSVGSVFLGGDAAHIHSPVGGQGMNMGIQDAYNLAWKLALVLRGKAAPSLLDSYHEERHRTDKEIVGMTDRATKVATIHNPVFSVVRNTLLRVVSRLDVVQRRVASTMSQVELHYRESSIVRDDWARRSVPGFSPGSPELRAGERVPDFALRAADGRGPTALYELMTGAEHELLVLCGVRPSAQELRTLDRVVQELGARYGELVEIHLIHGEERPAGAPAVASTHVDPELAMHTAFGAAVASLVLIRPDGYIGYRNQPADPAALRAYLDGIFRV
ncbi:MAG: FAD-dependent monooxygenase [Myxococcales bacterium]|nr:FAD-dependent monooxygenase [Myxococcales bacterium]